MLSKAIVVEVHPDDHSVDLVMLSTRARYTGIQVASSNGSSRSGTIDLPEVPQRKDKWDISTDPSNQVIALVAEVGYTPVVMGFIYPQTSQMTHDDGRLKYNRHTSDVQTYTDGDGNMGILHPSGAFITLAESPDPRDFSGKNVDKNLAIDRNTGKKVHLRVALAGNVAVLTMTPDGACTLHLDKTLDIECTTATIKASESITLNAKQKIVLDAPDTQITGYLEVKEQVTVDSDIVSMGDQLAGGISQINHTHGGVESGKSNTAKPS